MHIWLHVLRAGDTDPRSLTLDIHRFPMPLGDMVLLLIESVSYGSGAFQVCNSQCGGFITMCVELYKFR
jgi:hypothetical protein